MVEDELEFEDHFEEEDRTLDISSYLKFHFLIKNIDTEGASFRQRLISELEDKVGPVQRDFVQIKPIKTGRSFVHFGMKYDADAERLLRRKVTIVVPDNESAKIEPTDPFKALLDYRVNKKPTKRSSRSRSPRSPRSPRTVNSNSNASSPVLLLLFTPNDVNNKDVSHAINELGIHDTPKVEYVFTDLAYAGVKFYIKLTFPHANAAQKVYKTELKLKGNYVLAIQPGGKNSNLEKELLNALPQFQVVVRGDASSKHVERILQRYGNVVDLRKHAGYLVATFSQSKSARDAIRDEVYRDENFRLEFKKRYL